MAINKRECPYCYAKVSAENLNCHMLFTCLHKPVTKEQWRAFEETQKSIPIYNYI